MADSFIGEILAVPLRFFWFVLSINMEENDNGFLLPSIAGWKIQRSLSENLSLTVIDILIIHFWYNLYNLLMVPIQNGSQLLIMTMQVQHLVFCCVFSYSKFCALISRYGWLLMLDLQDTLTDVKASLETPFLTLGLILNGFRSIPVLNSTEKADGSNAQLFE